MPCKKQPCFQSYFFIFDSLDSQNISIGQVMFSSSCFLGCIYKERTWGESIGSSLDSITAGEMKKTTLMHPEANLEQTKKGVH